VIQVDVKESIKSAMCTQIEQRISVNHGFSADSVHNELMA